MTFDEILPTLISMLEKVSGKCISKAQIAVLRAAWEGIEYADMTDETTHNTGYLHRTVAPKVFKFFSEALGEKINKRSFRSKIEALMEISSSKSGQIFEKGLIKKSIGRPSPAKLFVGRKKELEELTTALSDKRCIYIYGASGIGKTSLMSRLLMNVKEDASNKFDTFVWKYVTHESPLDEIQEIEQLLELKGDESFESFIKKNRLLLCLDGIERWSQSNHKIIENFFHKFILTEHNSRIICTGREPMTQLETLMKLERPAKTLKLSGLGLEEVERILKYYSVSGDWLENLTLRYAGNPFLIHLLGEKIKNNGGSLEPFLSCKTSLAKAAMTPSLNQLFTDNPELGEVGRAILSFLSNTENFNKFTILEVAQNISAKHSFEYSEIIQSIETLKNYSLIEYIEGEDKNEVPAYLKRYVRRDPLSIFSPDLPKQKKVG